MEGTASCVERRGRKRDLPAARASRAFLVDAGGHAADFRYFAEGAGGHLFMVTMVDPRRGLLKLIFSPHQAGEVEELLRVMRGAFGITWRAWPSAELPAVGGAQAPGDIPGAEERL